MIKYPLNLRSMSEDELLRVWFELGDRDPWEFPPSFAEVVKDELVRRGMPVVQKTGIE